MAMSISISFIELSTYGRSYVQQTFSTAISERMIRLIMLFRMPSPAK
jgi:hypothetical protein